MMDAILLVGAVVAVVFSAITCVMLWRMGK